MSGFIVPHLFGIGRACPPFLASAPAPSKQLFMTEMLHEFMGLRILPGNNGRAPTKNSDIKVYALNPTHF